MVSYHGYWNYQDLIQTYDLDDLRRFPPKEKYNKDSVYGYVCDSPQFSVFKHLLKTANLDKNADHPQFNCTIFICDDKTLFDLYGETFFMNMDRNTALSLVNFHMFNRSIGKKTLLSKKGCLIQTKKEDSQMSVDILSDDKGQQKIHLNQQAFVISDEIKRTNGMIYLIDNLLFPENL
jgi:uncharacterized surface protein with fasciclin (FAS1) repeats